MTTGDTRRGLVMEEELAMLAVVRFATQQPPVAASMAAEGWRRPLHPRGSGTPASTASKLPVAGTVTERPP
jgi:hypothetical protein